VKHYTDPNWKQLKALIPSDLHKRFKKKCDEKGRQRGVVIIELIEKFLEEGK